MKGYGPQLALLPFLSCLLITALSIVAAFVRIVCVDELAFHVIETAVRGSCDVNELDFERVAISVVRVDIAVAFTREVGVYALRHVRCLADVVLPVSEVVDDIATRQLPTPFTRSGLATARW